MLEIVTEGWKYLINNFIITWYSGLPLYVRLTITMNTEPTRFSNSLVRNHCRKDIEFHFSGCWGFLFSLYYLISLDVLKLKIRRTVLVESRLKYFSKEKFTPHLGVNTMVMFRWLIFRFWPQRLYRNTVNAHCKLLGISNSFQFCGASSHRLCRGLYWLIRKISNSQGSFSLSF